ncbi:MAG: hypothetical protein FWF56_06060 [Firmicutes bacterium]|nr:hypothetical protein [Bacillota bacterium]MCL1953462.1 hypothetical protein [Bacillota bacterium]
MSNFDESKVNRDIDGKFASKDIPSMQKQFDDLGGVRKVPENISNLLGQEYKDIKGQDAISKLLHTKQGHVKAAFSRVDIGDIDLIWGNNEMGLQHILKRRSEQGIDIDKFIASLSNTIEKGEYVKTNDRGRYEFWHHGNMVIVSPELQGNKMNFVLTAFKQRKK